MKEKIGKFIESLGWSVYKGETYYNISKYSNLGEDFSFSINKSNTIQELEEIIDYCENFDSEEHASFYIENRGKYGIPNSIRELLDDAEEISESLQELGEKLESLLIELEDLPIGYGFLKRDYDILENEEINKEETKKYFKEYLEDYYGFNIIVCDLNTDKHNIYIDNILWNLED